MCKNLNNQYFWKAALPSPRLPPGLECCALDGARPLLLGVVVGGLMCGCRCLTVAEEARPDIVGVSAHVSSVLLEHLDSQRRRTSHLEKRLQREQRRYQQSVLNRLCICRCQLQTSGRRAGVRAVSVSVTRALLQFASTRYPPRQ